jgi:TrwC relaxase
VHTANRDLGRDIVLGVVCVGSCVVTVRVTTLRGAAAGAYYVEHLPTYYLTADEPAGVWLGHGADALGLTDELTDESFLAVMAGMHPNTPDHTLGGVFNYQSVRGFDVTCSAPLCRTRHNGAYAESVIMPIGVVGGLFLVIERCRCSA